jgi:hypothetical protein
MLRALELVIAVRGGSCEADWRFVGARGGCRRGARMGEGGDFLAVCWVRSKMLK